MTAQLRRRKIEDGLYLILDETDAVVAEVYEAGVSGYRWRVTPSRHVFGATVRGWDSRSISDAVAALSVMMVGRETTR